MKKYDIQPGDLAISIIRYNIDGKPVSYVVRVYFVIETNNTSSRYKITKYIRFRNKGDRKVEYFDVITGITFLSPFFVQRVKK